MLRCCINPPLLGWLAKLSHLFLCMVLPDRCRPAVRMEIPTLHRCLQQARLLMALWPRVPV